MEETTKPHGFVWTSCFDPGVHMCSCETGVNGTVLVCIAAAHLYFEFITATLVRVLLGYGNRYLLGVMCITYETRDPIPTHYLLGVHLGGLWLIGSHSSFGQKAHCCACSDG